MSININSQAPQSKLVVEQNKAQQQKGANASESAKTASSTKDSVQLTSQAVNLKQMQKTSSESQVNMKRVETLKAAILNGEYKINSERLAEKLNQFEGDFNKAFVN